jgi:hypothetical protein
MKYRWSVFRQTKKFIILVKLATSSFLFIFLPMTTLRSYASNTTQLLAETSGNSCFGSYNGGLDDIVTAGRGTE